MYEIFFLELGVWPAEQESQAAGPGGWQTASSGCGPGGGVRVHSRGGHQDDTDRHCIQVVTINVFTVFFLSNLNVLGCVYLFPVRVHEPLLCFSSAVLPGHPARPRPTAIHPAHMPSSRFLCGAITAPPHCTANFHWLTWLEMSEARMSTAMIAPPWLRLRRSTAVC